MARKPVESFFVELDRFVTDDISVDVAKNLLITDTLAERDRLISSHEAGSTWKRRVNNVPDAPESALKVGGSILYNFSTLSQAVRMGLEECRRRSPVRSGNFQKAWIVLYNDVLWEHEPEDLPFNAEVYIVNPAPYARKIDTGGMKMSMPPKIIEGARQVVRRTYPEINVARKFINLSGHMGRWNAPYLLRRDGGRRGSRSGQPITYPALVLRDTTYR